MNTIGKRLSPTLLLVAALEAGAQIPTPEARAALSRAEVIADYQIWEQSGMAALVRQSTDDHPDVSGDRYQRAHAEYMRLRQSPDFALLVRRIEQERSLQPTEERPDFQMIGATATRAFLNRRVEGRLGRR
jgi:hypothetical protein